MEKIPPRRRSVRTTPRTIPRKYVSVDVPPLVSGNTYLTSLRWSWTVTRWKVEIKFHLECKLSFPCAQFMWRQVHWTKLSVSIEAKYWVSWRLKNAKTSVKTDHRAQRSSIGRFPFCKWGKLTAQYSNSRGSSLYTDLHDGSRRTTTSQARESWRVLARTQLTNARARLQCDVIVLRYRYCIRASFM